ncbi:MAG: hypothetical protein ACUVRU_01300 [Anaerolineae bacterium]
MKRIQTPKSALKATKTDDGQKAKPSELYVNFFLPVTKLVDSNSRRVIKTYDAPRIPYQRVLDSSNVPEAVKQQLRRQYATLDMVQLKREINALNGHLVGSTVRFRQDARVR